MKVGKYKLLKPLGEGGSASVWLAQAKHSKLYYAIKLILSHQVMKSREQFISEINILNNLRHPNIVKLYDYGVVSIEDAQQLELGLPEGAPYCVMELHSQGTYAEQKPMVWNDLYDVLVQVLEVLSVVHSAGIVHCDLKPSNILKSNRGPILSDFGIAQNLDRSNLERHKQIEQAIFSGTPSYISPEQINNHLSQLGPWTDLYSLGCLAYKLSTGQTPFSSNSIIQTIFAHIEKPPPPLQTTYPYPKGFEGWAKHCLEKETLKRPCFAIHALHELMELNKNDSSVHYSISKLKAIPPHWSSQKKSLWTQIKQHLNGDTHSSGIALLQAKDGKQLRLVSEDLLRFAHSQGLAMPLKVHYHAEVGENSGIAGLLRREWCAYDLNHGELCKYLQDNLTAKYTNGTLEEMDIPSLASFISIPEDPLGVSSVRARLSAFNRWINSRLTECPRILWIENIQWGHELLSWLKKVSLNHNSKLFILISYQVKPHLVNQTEVHLEKADWFQQRTVSLEEIKSFINYEETSLKSLSEINEESPNLKTTILTSPKLKELAVVCAVIGQDFSKSIYERVCQRLGVSDYHNKLMDMLKIGIIQSEIQGRLSFTNPDLREVFLEQINIPEQFASYHKLIAEERMKEANANPIMVIQHWLAAKEIDQALTMIPLEVERIKRIEDYNSLKSLLNLWIKCLRQVNCRSTDKKWLSLKVYWSEYCGFLDQQKRAARHAYQAVKRLEKNKIATSLLIDAYIRRAESLKWNLQASNEVLAIMNEAVKTAKQIGDPVKCAHTLERQAVFQHTYGNLAAAELSFKKALELVDSLIVPQRLKSILHLGIGRLLIERDQLSNAKHHCEYALGLLNQKYHHALRASILLTLGDISRQLKNNQPAVNHYKSAYQIFKSLDAPELWATHLNLALVYADIENWGQAEQEFKQALDLTINTNSMSFIKLIKSCSLYSTAHIKDWPRFDRVLSDLLALNDHRYAQFDSAVTLERLALHLAEEGEEQRSLYIWRLTHAHFLSLGLHERAAVAQSFIEDATN